MRLLPFLLLLLPLLPLLLLLLLLLLSLYDRQTVCVYRGCCICRLHRAPWRRRGEKGQHCSAQCMRL
jgi:hypothetical protein